MSSIPCGGYILDVVELTANEEAGHILDFYLVGFEKETVQQCIW